MTKVVKSPMPTSIDKGYIKQKDANMLSKALNMGE